MRYIPYPNLVSHHLICGVIRCPVSNVTKAFSVLSDLLCEAALLQKSLRLSDPCQIHSQRTKRPTDSNSWLDSRGGVA
jgi:hypothetical protein